MRIVALMPTYRRRKLVENAIACFLSQTYEDKFLIVCDDSGEFEGNQFIEEGYPVWVISKENISGWVRRDGSLDEEGKFVSVSKKYDWMANLAFNLRNADAIAVMEDDDTFAPQYLENHVKALEVGGDISWSHPSSVWTDGTGGGPKKDWYLEYNKHTNMHGALAMTKEMYYLINGWNTKNQYGFDVQLLGRLNKICPAVDCTQFGDSQFYFRWGSSQLPHGECFNGDDWMKKYQEALNQRLGPLQVGPLTPRFDDETRTLYQKLGYPIKEGL